VKDCYKSILIALDKPYKWHDVDEHRYARSIPTNPDIEIWCGTQFWPAPDMGTNSKAGTVVHELAHKYRQIYGQILDLVYGQPACKDLARSLPHRAIHNADNYEYFAEGAQ
jgi:peptidyl-Lys metalloendopeptidase